MMDAIKLFLFFVDVFFVIYLIGYSTFLFLSVVVGASELYEKRMDEKMKGTLRHDFYIPISIIVPAHNEEMTVVDTVFSLLEQDSEYFAKQSHEIIPEVYCQTRFFPCRKMLQFQNVRRKVSFLFTYLTRQSVTFL